MSINANSVHIEYKHRFFTIENVLGSEIQLTLSSSFTRDSSSPHSREAKSSAYPSIWVIVSSSGTPLSDDGTSCFLIISSSVMIDKEG